MTLAQLQELVDRTCHPNEFRELLAAVPEGKDGLEELSALILIKGRLLAEIGTLTMIACDADPLVWRQTLGPTRKSMFEMTLSIVESRVHAIELAMELEISRSNAECAAESVRTAKVSAVIALLSAIVAAVAVGVQVWGSWQDRTVTVVLSEPVALSPIHIDPRSLQSLTVAVPQPSSKKNRDERPKLAREPSEQRLESTTTSQ